MTNRIFGGIEGGGTKTIALLMDSNGTILAECTGASSNPWGVGFEKSCAVINELSQKAKKQAKIPENERLLSMGLCISGIETVEAQERIKSILEEQYPDLSENYYVNSDTTAPVAMVSDKGGVVLISGTGSNCLLINPDESHIKCGGFGDRLGDEGSAYWIVHTGLKICADNNVKLNAPPCNYSSAKLWQTAVNYFKLKDTYDLITLYYANYDKTTLAAFCSSMATLAREGDELCKWIFASAGALLAKHVQAVYHSADQSLKQESGGLHVVCVGSVWHSWDLLKDGFVKQLKNTTFTNVEKLVLLQTTRSVAIGAVYLAAHAIRFKFPYSYEKNYKIFYEYGN